MASWDATIECEEEVERMCTGRRETLAIIIILRKKG